MLIYFILSAHMLFALSLESQNPGKITMSLLSSTTTTSTILKSQTSSASFLRKMRDSCDGGMGITGKCVTFSSAIKTLKLPDKAQEMMTNSVLPWMTKITGLMVPQFCIGDFSQTEIDKDKFDNKQSFGCSAFPLKAGTEYGVVGISVDNIPCGKPVTVAACLIFDKCGTVGLAVNGGVLTCLATLSTGVGAVLSAVAGVLKTAAIGVSVDRRFELDYTLVYPSDDHSSVEEKTVTAFGHLYFGVQLELELSDLSEKLKSLDKYFALSGKVSYMIDLGHLGSTASSIWDEIKGSSKSKAHDILKSIASEGGDVTVQYSGSLSLKLRELTDSFLSDIELELGKVNFLVTLAGGATGLPMGIYMYFESNIAQGLLTALNELSEQLGGILDMLGFKMPSLKSLDINAGFFLNTQAIGFKFDFLGLDVQCMYQFGVKKGSCKFHDKIFTAILNAGKWVIKEAKKLFDEAGAEIVEVDQKIGNFAKKTFDEAKTGVKKLAKAAVKDVKVAEKDIAHVATTGVKDVGHVAITAVKDLGKAKTVAKKAITSIAKKLHL